MPYQTRPPTGSGSQARDCVMLEKAGLLGRDGPLPGVFDAVDLPGQRPPAPRQSEGAGVDPLRHVELGPLVVVAHQGEDVGHRELSVRRQRKRIGLRAGLRAVVVGREDAATAPPAARCSIPACRKSAATRASAGSRPRRSGTAGPISDRTSPCSRRSSPRSRSRASWPDRRGGFRRCATWLQWQEICPSGIRTAAQTAPLPPGPRADDLQDPRLLGIGDGDRLALVRVAVLGDQLGHHLDGLAGGAGPLQAQASSSGVVDQPLRIVHLLPAAEGGLGHGELVLVHQARQHSVGVRHLRNLAARALVGRRCAGRSRSSRPACGRRPA